MTQDSLIKYIVVAIVVICITIVAVVFIFVANPGSPSSHQNQARPYVTPAVDISKVKITGNPFIGKEDAPVTIAYWYDYQCPFCRKTEQEVMPQLITDYVNTGKVKVVYKDLQFIGFDSITAGLASRAVWDIAPDKFELWHKTMFDKQGAENSGWASKANILAITKSVGIDSDKVNQLMTQNAAVYKKAMDSDRAQARSFGITTTPGIIVGKHLLAGTKTYADFKTAIDKLLAGK